MTNYNEPQIGIKPSKKFANGSVHENGTGKFEILERFLENNVVMLKYRWLTGEFEGQEDTNKEVNVNASIWKFQKVRGLVGGDNRINNLNPSNRNDMYENLIEKIEEIQAYQHEREEGFMDNMENVHRGITKTLEYLEDVMQSRKSTFDQLDRMQSEILHLTKSVEDKNQNISKLMELAKINQEQISHLTSQYDIATKLIEKM